MNTALIEQLDITTEEYNLIVKKVQGIAQVHNKKNYERGVLSTMFKEWQFFAGRVNQGGGMLDKAFAMGSENSQEYLRQLEDLYTLQLQMIGMYEMVFREALDEENFQNTLDSIYNTITAIN
jgi:hypothetical protein